jgi:alkanesulfonate monooxygenase SsuD/methylene tetrahydromethanopterin reductase-like flavin-dependent oxidoreductase (luciferase family)
VARRPRAADRLALTWEEAAGADRFRLGFGASRIFMKEIGAHEVKPLNPTRDSLRIVRGVLGGEPFDYDGPAFSAHVPIRRAVRIMGSAPILRPCARPRSSR